MKLSLQIRPVALAFLLLGSCQDLGHESAGGAGTAGDGPAPALRDFADDWSVWPLRAWPGPDWYANRVQDWRLREGRLECLDAEGRTAGRTVHLLTRRFLEQGSGGLTLAARVEPVDAELGEDVGVLRFGAAVGFLVGVGGAHVDPRASALVQQEPGPDGGLLCVLEADGRLALLDFEQYEPSGANWTPPGHADFSALPAFGRSEGSVPAGTWPVDLEVRWKSDKSLPEGGSVTLSARHEGAVVASVTAPVARTAATGGVALFSSRGPEDSGHGFAFEAVRVKGAADRSDLAFGPVLGALQLPATNRAGERSLRIAAQLPVLGTGQVRAARLLLWDLDTSTWRDPVQAHVRDDNSWIAPFRVDNWTERRSVPYRIEVELGRLDGNTTSYSYEGLVRGEPAPDEPVLVAALACMKNQVGPIQWNSEGLWFPHAELEAALHAEDPDLVLFLGDQIYEGDVTPPDTRYTIVSDYHTKWQRFLWSFGELLRDRPAICLPDDHDVFQGNLWGAGGVRAHAQGDITAQDAGGYVYSAEFVRAVHATQTSNLPPTEVKERIGQGVTTWSSTFAWGGIDFAVVSDRMWKASPAVAQPKARYQNGWAQTEGFDTRQAPPDSTELLGRPQEALLRAWAEERAPDTWTRVLLSESPFSALHTLPSGAKSDAVVPGLPLLAPGEYPPDDRPAADADSNGWPQGGRHRAVEILRNAGALHLAGDQHLASVAWYGVDRHRDGTVVFTVPAIANAWPRRWMPTIPGRGGEPKPTGDFVDGFGNKVSVLAVGNPVSGEREPKLLHDRAPGYALLRFDPEARTVELEALRRPAAGDTGPLLFPGWPIVLGADGRPR